MYQFPTKKKRSVERDTWRKLVNRVEDTNTQLWQASKDACVCSKYFIDRMPTTLHPFATLELGYDPATIQKKVELLSPPTKKRSCTTAALIDISSSCTFSGSINNAKQNETHSKLASDIYK